MIVCGEVATIYADHARIENNDHDNDDDGDNAVASTNEGLLL